VIIPTISQFSLAIIVLDARIHYFLVTENNKVTKLQEAEKEY